MSTSKTGLPAKTGLSIQTKRAYAPASPEDGYRILVDRLWPRGISKARAAIDAWEKQLAPSDELREWFGHDPQRWEEFKQRYFAELAAQPEQVAALRQRAAEGPITLVYVARDEQHNNAVALKEYLESGQ